MARSKQRVAGVVIPCFALLVLSGCEGFELPFGGDNSSSTGTNESTAAAMPGEEIDVEAPEVFRAAESGLWDGRPSLGGVWVAHPDVGDPERVIIVNEANGSSVIGALFRRERDIPGPRIQVSSDAAIELGMLAGQPTQLTVTALRREVVEAPAPAPVALPDAQEIEATPLEDDPLAAAANAIDAAESAPVITAATAPAPAAAPTPVQSSLEKPFIQIGIFSIESNANNTGASLRNAGIIPTILRQESQGKVFWRVIVGPATTQSDRAEVLSQVKALGYSDAYFVTN